MLKSVILSVGKQLWSLQLLCVQGTRLLHVSQMAVTERKHRVEIMSDISALLPREHFEKHPSSLPPLSTDCPHAWLWRSEEKQERAAPPPPTDWFKQALGGQGVGGVWGVAHWACPVRRNALWWQHSGLLPSADGVCTSRPRPFSIQSSEQPDQFTVEWTQSQWPSHMHTHTHIFTHSLCTTAAATQSPALQTITHSSLLMHAKTQ